LLDELLVESFDESVELSFEVVVVIEVPVSIDPVSVFVGSDVELLQPVNNKHENNAMHILLFFIFNPPKAF